MSAEKAYPKVSREKLKSERSNAQNTKELKALYKERFEIWFSHTTE